MIVFSNEVDKFFGSYDMAFKTAKEELIENGVKMPSENQIWMKIDEIIADGTDLFISAIKEVNINDKWLLTGIISRWNGRFPGGKMFETLKEAFDAVYSKYDYVTIEQHEDGSASVRCVHHDGVDCFELHRIPKSAIEWYNENKYERSEKELHDELKKYAKKANPANPNLTNLLG